MIAHLSRLLSHIKRIRDTAARLHGQLTAMSVSHDRDTLIAAIRQMRGMIDGMSIAIMRADLISDMYAAEALGGEPCPDAESDHSLLPLQSSPMRVSDTDKEKH